MDFINLVHECAPWVAPQTMAAIVKTESQFRPYAIGVNAKGKLVRQPKSKAEAISTANWLIANGYNIDLGLGQLNSNNLRKYNLTVEEAFEPCKNLTVAATILKENFQSASYSGTPQMTALYAALSAYNTGSFKKGFQNGYVRKVVNNASQESPQIIVPAIKPSEPEASIQEKITENVQTENMPEPVKVQKIEENKEFKDETTVYQPQEQERNIMVY